MDQRHRWPKDSRRHGGKAVARVRLCRLCASVSGCVLLGEAPLEPPRRL